MWDRNFEPFLGDIWVGGLCTLVEVSQIFAVVKNDFFQKMSIFRDFWDTSTKTTPKTTFYCIFINKFPKNDQESAQNFFATPTAPQKILVFQICSLWTGDPSNIILNLSS